MDGTLQSLHHKSERTGRLWSLARRVISFSVVHESPLTLNISPAEISNKTRCIHRLFYFFYRLLSCVYFFPPFLSKPNNLARQPVCEVINSETLHIHLANVHWKSFSVSLVFHHSQHLFSCDRRRKREKK